MTRILSFIAADRGADAVVDAAAWASRRLDLPVEFVHVIDRHPERAQVVDYSGAIGFDAQQDLLRLLAEQDERLSVALRDAGRELLARARLRAAAAGATRVDARLRHGDLVETAAELQSGAALLVIGSHAGAGASRRGDDPVDRIVRTVAPPALVAGVDGHAVPKQVVVVCGGALPAKSAAAIAAHPLVAGLPVVVIRAAADTPAVRRDLDDARSRLAAAGFVVTAERVDGDAALASFVASRSPALVVVDGGSRRRWFGRRGGAVPAAVARLRGVPVLVLR